MKRHNELTNQFWIGARMGVEARKAAKEQPEVEPQVQPEVTPEVQPDDNQSKSKSKSNIKSESESKTTASQIVVFSKELDRVIERIKTLRNSYDPHSDWTPDDREELKKLRNRQKELKSILGVQV